MEFCDDCDSILYLKSDVSEDGDELRSNLVYECKLCGFIKNTKPEDKCIYTRDHSGEYLSYKILTNPYICEDPTLPILNNIDCPNEGCIVNKSVTSMKNYIVFSPVMFNNRNDVIEEIRKVMVKNKYEEVKTIENSKEYMIQTEQTRLTLCLSNKLKRTTIDKFIKSFDASVFKDYDIEIKRFERPERRVTYIKYNKSDMKFIYICTHCNTYWKR